MFSYLAADFSHKGTTEQSNIPSNFFYIKKPERGTNFGLVPVLHRQGQVEPLPRAPLLGEVQAVAVAREDHVARGLCPVLDLRRPRRGKVLRAVEGVVEVAGEVEVGQGLELDGGVAADGVVKVLRSFPKKTPPFFSMKY